MHKEDKLDYETAEEALIPLDGLLEVEGAVVALLPRRVAPRCSLAPSYKRR